MGFPDQAESLATAEVFENVMEHDEMNGVGEKGKTRAVADQVGLRHSLVLHAVDVDPLDLRQR